MEIFGTLSPKEFMYPDYKLKLLLIEIKNQCFVTFRDINSACTWKGIRNYIIPYSPLARGLVTATITDTTQSSQDDFRRTLPRFDEHWDNNRQLISDFAALAKDKNCAPAQLALAWVLAQRKDIIPIPGNRRENT